MPDTNDELVTFYRIIFSRRPHIWRDDAIHEGLDKFGRETDSPTIEDHEAAFDEAFTLFDFTR